MKDRNGTANATISRKSKRRCVLVSHAIPLCVAVTILALGSRGEALAQVNGAGVDSCVKSLLHMDGVQFSTAFVDETSKTWTAYGEAKLKQDNRRYGTASVYFDGAGDYLETPDTDDFDPGTDAFTVDFWIYPESLGGESVGQQIYLAGKSNPTSGLGYDIRLAGGKIYVSGLNGWAVNIQTDFCISLNTWQHIALSVTPDTAYLFVGGVLRKTCSRSAIPGTTEPLCIGWRPSFAGVGFKGFLDEFRYSRGIARWTGNFTDPYALTRIVTQPQGINVLQHDSGQFTVAVSAMWPLQYQWFKDGVPIYDSGRMSGASSSVLTISDIGSGDQGQYWVVVTQPFGVLTSDAATLRLIDWSSINEGLLAYYPFDTDANDHSGHPEANLSNVGATPAVADNRACFYFLPGSYTYHANFNLTRVPLSISLWFKANSVQYEGSKLISNWGYTQPDVYRGFRLKTANPNYIDVVLGNPSANSYEYLQSYEQSAWYHLVACYDAGGVSAYVNGVLRRRKDMPLSFSAKAPKMWIGGRGTSYDDWWGNFGGWIDEVRIYDRVLSASEVRLLYQQVTGPPVITAHPASQIATVGTTVTFNVAASGMEPLTYQWRKDGNILTDGEGLSGAITHSLTIAEAEMSDDGSYDVVVTDPAGGAVTSNAATLAVTPAPATVILGELNQIYDGRPKAITVATDPPNVPVNVTYDGGATVPVNGGTYQVLVTVSDPNYIGSASGTLVIGKAEATVVVKGYAGCYDGVPHEASGTATGVGGEDLSARLSLVGAFTDVPGGTAHWTFSGGQNYNDQSGNVGIVLIRAEATVTANPKSKTYGQANPVLDAVVVGEVAGGDAVAYSLSTTAQALSGVGSYPITVTLGNNPNYSVTATDSALTVGAAVATVTANPKSKTYGEDNPVLDATVTGSVNGDAIDYTLSTGAEKFSHVGDYWITVNPGTNPNYAVNAVNGVLTVTPASLDVTIHGPVSGLLQTVDTPVEFTGSFTPTGNEGQYSAQWTLSSAAIPETTVDGTIAGLNVTANIQFPTPGVYLVTLTVCDPTGTVGEADLVENDLLAYVVIYDPDGGFVTGGGWINSPAGAFHRDLEEFAGVTGKATFGFVAKYLKGAKVPTGNTEFQFKAGNLNFKSNAYQWLVVAGARAQYKGWGTINNLGEYAFILTAIDGALLGGNSADRFRIKIWDEDSGTVVYDNQAGAADTADLTTDGTLLGGGSIVIHKP